MKKVLIIFSIFACSCAAYAQSIDSLPWKKPTAPLRFNSIQSDHYTKHMGFMCKKELQLQKITKIPVFIRLGSLEYTNYLEGKGKLH